MAEREAVGIILSGASTESADCQLYDYAERGKIREGMFLLIPRGEERGILVRVAKMIPQNEYYTKGDAWSEARRKRLPIPDQIARQYEVCELEILGEVPRLRSVTNPPYAGEEVIKIDVSKNPRLIFEVDQRTPGIVWYGSLIGYENAPIPLTIEGIPMHMAVFGTTGSGKSHNVGSLIERFVTIYDNENSILSLPLLIIDANADYIDYVEYFEKTDSFGAASNITRYVFPNSPEARIKKRHTRQLGINLNYIGPRDLAEIIVQYYHGGERNELQVSAIESLLDRLQDRLVIARPQNNQWDYQRIFTSEEMFRSALDNLDDMEEEHLVHSQTKPAVERALRKFREIDSPEFRLLSTSPQLGFDFVDRLTKEREIDIIDFSADGAPGVSLALKQLVMSYLAAILYSRFTQYKIKREERYLVFIIEEAQNYAPNLSVYDVGYSLAREKLAIIATQGRKFGLSLCLISQRPSFVDPVVLSMCNSFFVHRVSPEDVSFVDKVTGGLPRSLGRKLTQLEQGELIVHGQMNKVPIPFLIKAPARNHDIGHRYGQTNVLEGLRRLKR
jgi:DNA helicase HerA-like ATPase